jgi:hypothetical protein
MWTDPQDGNWRRISRSQSEDNTYTLSPIALNDVEVPTTYADLIEQEREKRQKAEERCRELFEKLGDVQKALEAVSWAL